VDLLDFELWINGEFPGNSYLGASNFSIYVWHTPKKEVCGNRAKAVLHPIANFWEFDNEETKHLQMAAFF